MTKQSPPLLTYGISVAAVYRYAAEGEASGFFSEEMAQEAFRSK
ncbi:MAG: hypothetical protein SWK90_16625 [Chloroflexota bacterium]|nr:hypothetical protein [Chloroflexota bacterium]